MKIRYILYALPLACLVGLVILFSAGLDAPDPPSRHLGRIAPTQDVQDLFSKTERFIPGRVTESMDSLEQSGVAPQERPKSEYRLVNFFASWCLPCKVEHPVLTRFSVETGVKIDGVAWKDEPVDSRLWLQRQGNPFARTGSDPTGNVSQHWGITGVPETFLIDPSGRIVFHHAGPLLPDIDQQKLRPALEPRS